MSYKKSDYAVNKYSDGIVYQSVTGEHIAITYEDMARETPGLSAGDFQSLKALSDEDYRLSGNRDNNYNRKKRPLDMLDGVKGRFALSPEEELAWREQMSKLREAMESLTETQLRRVRLFYFEELTEAEIARLEGVSQKRISKSIVLAREKMKKYLKQGG